MAVVSRLLLAGLFCLAFSRLTLNAALFELPTDNRSILEPAGEARFFAPTPGRTWMAGQFGCVRSEGTQIHEGIDILVTRRDRRGEPLDEVRAAAGGEVVYINRKPGLSNYGIYVVLRHHLEGIDVFTLYAHLREARPDLAPGRKVQVHERLGTMGRTSNTASVIGKDRAHVHFEVNLLVNEGFSSWLRQKEPSARDDHGPWNGRNLLGLDPAEVLLEAHAKPKDFSILQFIRTQREMCRVLIANTSFPWLRRYPLLIRRNPVAESAGIVAYEVSLNFNGLPFLLVPRSPGEIDGPVTTRLLSVDAREHSAHPCRKLVFQRGQKWVLTARGEELIALLTHK